MKPFFPFYNRSYGYLRAIITLIIGIVLIVWPEKVKDIIVIILGALILAIGITSLIISYAGKSKTEKISLLSINGFVNIAFGLVLVIFPSFFVGFLMFLFGFALLVFGIGEIASLFITRRKMKIPAVLFLGPILTTLCGIVMFFNPFKASEWLFIFFGASLVVYSLSEFLSTITIRSIQKNLPKDEKPKEQEVQDVDFVEVDK